MNYLESAVLVLHVARGGRRVRVRAAAARQGRGHGRGVRQRLVGQPVRRRGLANFLSRTTAILATVFFVTSLGLTYIRHAARQADRMSIGTAACPSSADGRPTPARAEAPRRDVPQHREAPATRRGDAPRRAARREVAARCPK